MAVADGEHIVAAIKQVETDYQNGVEQMNEDLEETFKRVRRILPVTGTKFNWA